MSAGVMCVVIIFFRYGFFAGKLDFISVYNNYIIAGIDMRRLCRLVFTHQYRCDFSSHSAQNRPFGVNEKPFLFNLIFLGHKALHRKTLFQIHKKRYCNDLTNIVKLFY